MVKTRWYRQQPIIHRRHTSDKRVGSSIPTATLEARCHRRVHLPSPPNNLRPTLELITIFLNQYPSRLSLHPSCTAAKTGASSEEGTETRVLPCRSRIRRPAPASHCVLVRTPRIIINARLLSHANVIQPLSTLSSEGGGPRLRRLRPLLPLCRLQPRKDTPLCGHLFFYPPTPSRILPRIRPSLKIIWQVRTLLQYPAVGNERDTMPQPLAVRLAEGAHPLCLRQRQAGRDGGNGSRRIQRTTRRTPTMKSLMPMMRTSTITRMGTRITTQRSPFRLRRTVQYR